jgi:FlgD Ig-like domain
MSKLKKEALLVLVLAAPLLAPNASANIYVTDLRFNGTEPLAIAAGFSTINITYVLNEPATVGVTINIASGTNLVRTLTAAPGVQGALFGRNSVPWDGNDSTGLPAPSGGYVISVTAAADGHTNWTQISQDTNAGNYVFDPRGLAVNNNSNSLYYGRVFLGNAGTGPRSATVPGDQITILKLNADGSFADEGTNGNGGYTMTDLGDNSVPQKMRVGADDRLYMMDLSSYSQLVAFDMLLSTNEIVLNPDNYLENPFWANSLSLGVGWFSMDVTDANTTNGLIWLGQWDSDGAGIWNWHLTNGVADPTNDIGNWAVAVGGSLSVAASGGLMVDNNYDIFVGQYLTDLGDPSPECMVFTNWNDGLSYGGEPVTNGAAWSVGGGDNTFLGVYDTTIDSRQQPNYVACALNGGPAGGIRILNAATGAVVVTNLDATNQYYVTAWDNVGNLYAASGTSHLLRVFSPPGSTNQATLNGAIQIESAITSITLNGNNLVIDFVASRGDSPSQFTLQSCATVNGSFVNVPGAVPTQIGPGVFTVSTTPTASVQFYRISEGAP